MTDLVPPMEPVRLVIDGIVHEGWTDISVSRSLERAAGDFSLGITDKRRGPDGVTVPPRLYCGAVCRLYIGADIVLTGYVDDVSVDYSPRDHAIKVSGRSKPCDLVDCSVDPSWSAGAGAGGGGQKPVSGLFHPQGDIARQVRGDASPTAGLSGSAQPVGAGGVGSHGGHFRGQRLAQVAAMLAQPYGVTVKVIGDSGDPFPGLTVEKGDKVLDVIERMCRLRGLLASDDAWGHLVLARPGQGRDCGALELGKTILAGTGRFSVKERYSEYRIFGQAPGLHRDSYGAASDDDELADPDASDDEGPAAGGPAVAPGRRADVAARAVAVASPQGVARDDGVTRYRLLVVQAETAAEAGGVQARAEWEAAHRLGKSISLTYTVPGWRAVDGQLWETNGVVHVIDPLMALDRSLVIGGVDFTLDGSGGMITKLTMAPLEAFEPEPLKAKKPKSGGGRGSDGKTAGQGLFAPRGDIARQVSEG